MLKDWRKKPLIIPVDEEKDLTEPTHFHANQTTLNKLGIEGSLPA
jgi:hypothetical protein